MVWSEATTKILLLLTKTCHKMILHLARNWLQERLVFPCRKPWIRPSTAMENLLNILKSKKKPNGKISCAGLKLKK
jgi:hypothetical protein